MIYTIAKFISGFLIGSLLVIVLAYSLGSLLENMGIVLYETESEQQRNFNIFLVLWLVIGTVSGYLLNKFWRKTNE